MGPTGFAGGLKGVEYGGQCYRGRRLQHSPTKEPDSDCLIPCRRSTETCGGKYQHQPDPAVGASGAFIMADQEKSMYGGNDTSLHTANTPIQAEYVTAMLKGRAGNFVLKGSDPHARAMSQHGHAPVEGLGGTGLVL